MRKGFTLIELLIAISITAILFSIGVAQYMKFNSQQILDQAVLELRTNLTQARNMALAGKKTCTGGFDGILVEFRDEAGAPSDKKYKISSSCNSGVDSKQIGGLYQYPQGVKKTGGPEEILFKPLTGGTNLNSPATITLFSGAGESEVQVSPSGKIELLE